jgi:hypothetical protein
VKRTIAAVGLAAAAATLALIGCADTNDNRPSPTAGPPAAVGQDPSTALSLAAARLQKQTFTMTVTSGDGTRLTGVMDPAARKGSFTMGGGSGADESVATTEMRFINGVTYIKVTIPGSTLPGTDGKTWRQMDGSTPGEGRFMFDAGELAGPLEQAADVRRVSDTHYTGSIDLAKSGAALGMPSTTLDKLSTTTVPFEATLDDQGRLTRYAFTTPAVGSQPVQRLDIAFADFGVRVDVQAPPADQIVRLAVPLIRVVAPRIRPRTADPVRTARRPPASSRLA